MRPRPPSTCQHRRRSFMFLQLRDPQFYYREATARFLHTGGFAMHGWGSPVPVLFPSCSLVLQRQRQQCINSMCPTRYSAITQHMFDGVRGGVEVTALVRYVGPTAFAEGTWVGVKKHQGERGAQCSAVISSRVCI